jgi:deazaflavin-dependent oxidoreductase (nitroreductase family)
MAKRYRVTPTVRLSNALVTLLLRLGVPLSTMTLLTVRGRVSGQPRRTPVTMIEYDGQRWLVAPFGAVNWVRNLRAAGEATLTRGRQVERISAVELSPAEAAPILKRVLGDVSGPAASVTRPYFDVAPTDPIDAFEREAPRHPVFLVRPASEVVSSSLAATARS